MKHIRVFEEEEDMLARYRELYDLGLIGLEDYYRDLEEAGYPIDRVWIEGEPRLRLRVVGQAAKAWIKDWVKGFEGHGGERIVDFELEVQGVNHRLEAVFSTGDWVRYRFEGEGRGRVRSAVLSGRRLTPRDLDSLNESVARVNSSTVEYAAINVVTVALLWCMRRLRAERQD